MVNVVGSSQISNDVPLFAGAFHFTGHPIHYWLSSSSWLRPIKRGQFRFANFAPHIKGKCHLSFALIPLVKTRGKSKKSNSLF